MRVCIEKRKGGLKVTDIAGADSPHPAWPDINVTDEAHVVFAVGACTDEELIAVTAWAIAIVEGPVVTFAATPNEVSASGYSSAEDPFVWLPGYMAEADPGTYSKSLLRVTSLATAIERYEKQ